MYNYDNYYESDYYEPPAKKPLNLGVVGATVLGGATGLVAPQAYLSMRDTDKGKLDKVKELTKTYKDNYDIANKNRKKTFAKHSKARVESILKGTTANNLAVLSEEGRLLKRQADIGEQIRKLKKLNPDDLADQIKQKREELQKAKAEIQQEKRRNLKTIKKEYAEIKKSLGNKPELYRETKGTEVWDGSKKYYLNTDTAEEIAKANSIKNKFKDDFNNLKGVGKGGRIGAGLRFVAAPLIGSGLGYLSGKAIFE